MINENKGKCKLCGRTKKLTYEHVPPAGAFNASTVTSYPFSEVMKLISGKDNRMPWDFEGLKGKHKQRGSENYYLCAECNSSTGSWYMEEYVKIARSLHETISRENPQIGEFYEYTLENVYPLRFYKAIMTMFCDINNECFGDKDLRDFLLEKENNMLKRDKYSIALHMVGTSYRRVLGLMCSIIPGVGMMTSSEIGVYPLGSTLYIDKPSGICIPGITIDDFLDCSFDEKCTVKFCGMPFLENNSLFPNDFRSKTEIVSSIDRAVPQNHDTDDSQI